MLNVVLGVLGAVRSTLKFVPFEATDGNFYLRVEGYECWANNETLSPQYNLGSVLIPGKCDCCGESGASPCSPQSCRYLAVGVSTDN